MDEIIALTDWINHYLIKFKEINEILGESRNGLQKTADMFESSFISGTTNAAYNALNSSKIQIGKVCDEVSDTINYLTSILNQIRNSSLSYDDIN